MAMSPRLLRPLASGVHPDAAAWRSAVIANGGTVSGSTLQAVSRFCTSIASAGIRDRFYRLNLFCGSNLNAALVPLYLTPDSTVRNLFQFGTDMTNAAWLAGGNGSATRTATTEAGPLGYGYATKLTTPSAPFDVRQMYQQVPTTGQQATVSVWMKTNTGTKQIQWVVGNTYSDTVTVTSTWQRFSKTFTLPSSGDARTGLSTVSELNDAGHILVWGMQCEYGATATDYTQPRYGNATDTNNAFVGVGTDYAEKGASGGLTGNGSTKWLNPGKQAGIKPDWLTHHFGIDIKDAYPDANNRYQMGAIFNEAVTSPRGQYGIRGTSSQRQVRSGLRILSDATANDALRIAVRASATDFRVYENGVQVGGTSTDTDTSTVLPDAAFAIMATSYQDVSAGVPTTVVTGYQPAVGIARGYTIGESMTAVQVLDFYSAWLAFQTSLGRT